jgi:hypothetical protein
MVRLTKEATMELLEFLYSLGGMPSGIRKTLDSMREQYDSPGFSKELVDTVAAYLVATNGRSLLTGRILEGLREALLSPSELAKVKALATTYAGCSSCGREFSDGSLATIVKGSPVCYHCVWPTTVRCGKCHNDVPATSTGIARIIKKALTECQKCAEGVKQRIETGPLRNPLTPPPSPRDRMLEPEELPFRASSTRPAYVVQQQAPDVADARRVRREANGNQRNTEAVSRFMRSIIQPATPPPPSNVFSAASNPTPLDTITSSWIQLDTPTPPQDGNS